MFFGLAMLVWDMSAEGTSVHCDFYGDIRKVLLWRGKCSSVTTDRTGPSELGRVCCEVVGSTASSYGIMKL